MVTTERAKHFYSPQDVPVTLYSDADEWEVSAGPIAFLPVGQSYLPSSLWSWLLEHSLGSSQWSGPLGRGNEENICLVSGLREAHSSRLPQAELSFGPVPGVECPCTYLG